MHLNQQSTFTTVTSFLSVSLEPTVGRISIAVCCRAALLMRPQANLLLFTAVGQAELSAPFPAPPPHPPPPSSLLQDPEISGLGYKNFFLPLLGSTFTFVILMMLRLRLFAALM